MYNNKILLDVISNGDVEEVKILLKEGADINFVDENGRGAAYHAVFSRKLDMLKFVLSHGVSANYTENNGDTLLHIAAGEGLLAMVELLLKEYHLDINTLNNENVSPLGISMLFTQMEPACCLIENGAKNIGTIYHLEALVKYVKKKIQSLKLKIDDTNKAQYSKRISILQDFIKSAEVAVVKPNNYKEIDGYIVQALSKMGFSKNKEIPFYKKNMEWTDKQKLLELFSVDQNHPEIRNLIWKCYLQNHITRFYTVGDIYSAYLLPFTTVEMERDLGITNDPGINIESFIKNIDTTYPKFGRDYYYPKTKNIPWFSLPDDKDEYDLSDLCIEATAVYKYLSTPYKYKAILLIWDYLGREEFYMIKQKREYFNFKD